MIMSLNIYKDHLSPIMEREYVIAQVCGFVEFKIGIKNN
jgi:hypothetical protein